MGAAVGGDSGVEGVLRISLGGDGRRSAFGRLLVNSIEVREYGIGNVPLPKAVLAVRLVCGVPIIPGPALNTDERLGFHESITLQSGS